MKKLISLALLGVTFCAPSSVWYRDIGDNNIDVTESYKMPLWDYLAKMRSFVGFKETHRYLEKNKDVHNEVEPRAYDVDSPVNRVQHIRKGGRGRTKYRSNVSLEKSTKDNSLTTTTTAMPHEVITDENQSGDIATTRNYLDRNSTELNESTVSTQTTEPGAGTTVTMTSQTDITATTEIVEGPTESDENTSTTSLDEVTSLSTPNEETSTLSTPNEETSMTDMTEPTTVTTQNETTTTNESETTETVISTESTESATVTTDSSWNENATLITELDMSTTTMPEKDSVIVVAELVQENMKTDLNNTHINGKMKKMNDGKVKVTVMTQPHKV